MSHTRFCIYIYIYRYGVKYEYIADIPFYTGQMTYSDIQTLINNQTNDGNPGILTYVNKSDVMRYQCHGFCNEAEDRTVEIWFDNPTTLTSKYNLAVEYNLKGIGMWEATHVDYTTDDANDMWAPIC